MGIERFRTMTHYCSFWEYIDHLIQELNAFVLLIKVLSFVCSVKSEASVPFNQDLIIFQQNPILVYQIKRARYIPPKGWVGP